MGLSRGLVGCMRARKGGDAEICFSVGLAVYAHHFKDNCHELLRVSVPCIVRALLGTTNIQQLWRQNFCSCWTSFVELSTGPSAQSRHHLPTRQQLKGHLFGNNGHGAL